MSDYFLTVLKFGSSVLRKNIGRKDEGAFGEEDCSD